MAETEKSKNTDWDSGDGEAIGHKSGKKIIQILRKKKAELTASDYIHTYTKILHIRVNSFFTELHIIKG